MQVYSSRVANLLSTSAARAGRLGLLRRPSHSQVMRHHRMFSQSVAPPYITVANTFNAGIMTLPVRP